MKNDDSPLSEEKLTGTGEFTRDFIDAVFIHGSRVETIVPCHVPDSDGFILWPPFLVSRPPSLTSLPALGQVWSINLIGAVS